MKSIKRSTTYLCNEPGNVSEKYRKHKRGGQLASATMPLLSLFLGVRHQLPTNEDFWKTILWPWLRHFANVYVDRLEQVTSTDYPRSCVKRIQFSKNLWIPVTDHTAFIYACVSLEEDYKLKSQIAYFINSPNNYGPRIVSLDMHIEKQSKSTFASGLIGIIKSLKRQMKERMSTISLKSSSFYYGNKLIVLHDSCFSLLDSLKIYFRSRGRIVFLQTNYKNTSQCKSVDIITRRKLLHEMLKNNVVDNELRLFLKVVAYQMPLAYIEDLNNNLARAKAMLKTPPGVVFYSNTGFLYAEALKCALALWRRSGTKLLIQAHGMGFYGICDCESWYDVETELADYYYSWSTYLDDKTSRSMPSILLSSNLCRFTSAKRLGEIEYDIVYVPVDRVPLQTETFSITPLDQVFCQKARDDFVELASKILIDRITVRRHPAYTHANGEYAKTFDGKTDSLRAAGFKSVPRDIDINQLFSCNILVFEYVSTLFSLALVCDIPCVIYLPGINNYTWNVRGERFIKLLINAKMLCTDPNSLIDTLSSDIVSWWSLASVVNAKKELRNYYAPTSENYLDEWLFELSNICDRNSNRIEIT